MPIFELVVAKGGFKLKEADPNNTYPNGVKGPDGVSHAGMFMIRNGSMTAQGVTVAEPDAVGVQVHRIVVDGTGLTGKYDISLQWTRDDDPGGDPKDTGKTESAGPSIFVALQEQLGLKLDAAKAPVEMIVVDHVEAPSNSGLDAGLQEGFDAGEVGFGVDADGVEGGGGDVDVDAVFEEAKLFEAFGVLEGAVGQGGE